LRFLVPSLTPPPVRKLIVYVNPFSGSGKAMKIYEKNVKPMFAEAQIQHEVVKTGLFLKIFNYLSKFVQVQEIINMYLISFSSRKLTRVFQYDLIFYKCRYFEI